MPDINWPRVSTDTTFIDKERGQKKAVVMVNLEGHGCIDYTLEKIDNEWKIIRITYPGYKSAKEFSAVLERSGALGGY
jgi:hypothetical protein